MRHKLKISLWKDVLIPTFSEINFIRRLVSNSFGRFYLDKTGFVILEDESVPEKIESFVTPMRLNSCQIVNNRAPTNTVVHTIKNGDQISRCFLQRYSMIYEDTSSALLFLYMNIVYGVRFASYFLTNVSTCSVCSPF
jgi:hypothetical protein